MLIAGGDFRLAEANAADDGPPFHEVQLAQQRLAIARNTLERFRAQGPQGYASGPPIANAHPGETIEAGVGGHSHDDVVKAFNRSVAELEQRAVAAEAEHQRISDRRRSVRSVWPACASLWRRAGRGLISRAFSCPATARAWYRRPEIVGPRSVSIAEPPAGTPSVISPPPAGPGGSGTPPAARAARGGMIARMI